VCVCNGSGVRYVLSLQCELAHADQVLGDLSEALFTFMSEESRPVDQVLVDLLQSLLIVLAQLHLERTQRNHNNVLTHVLDGYIFIS